MLDATVFPMHSHGPEIWYVCPLKHHVFKHSLYMGGTLALRGRHTKFQDHENAWEIRLHLAFFTQATFWHEIRSAGSWRVCE